jgi:hypothetical protein
MDLQQGLMDAGQFPGTAFWCAEVQRGKKRITERLAEWKKGGK